MRYFLISSESPSFFYLWCMFCDAIITNDICYDFLKKFEFFKLIFNFIVSTMQAVLFIACCILCVDLSTTLECYVCDNQEDNEGKCKTSIQTCNYGEDVCLTEINWGSIPYWRQGAVKQHFISKRCSTKEKCENFRSNNMATCTHIWYEDWKCSECCKGDRCNYYIISAGQSNSIWTHLILGVLALQILNHLYTLL